MKLTLQTAKTTWKQSETIEIQVLAINDSYEGATLDRRWLVGPNAAPARPMGGLPMPVSVESEAPTSTQNQVYLNPWGVFGRIRTYNDLPAGKVVVHAYLLNRLSDALLLDKPAEADALWISAEPLELTIE
ncbi:MAG: hypothetical protein L0154_00215 [Chloroflexi bacterium]|nr:hypothetical protein [Chloroflexota bacterium]